MEPSIDAGGTSGVIQTEPLSLETTGTIEVKISPLSGTVLAKYKLVPAPGTWRLFLQTKVGGRVVTAPFTLDVK